MTAASTPIEMNDRQSDSNVGIISAPPISSSCTAGWKNIWMQHYSAPPWEMPEIVFRHHTILMLKSRQPTEIELLADAKAHRLSFDKDRSGGIDIFPARVPYKYSWDRPLELTVCFLDPTFIRQVAYESVDPDRVELLTSLQQPSPFIWQMGVELRSILAREPENSCFYADTIATVMAAHLLTNYATRRHVLKEYDGLPKAKLKLAIEYINAHLGENVSLSDMATQLDMSQYHFSRLFKQSMGMPPHTYLIDRRVARSKQLLRETELTVLEISNECGFANPSHFARCFRQQMGVTPQQFRRSVS